MKIEKSKPGDKGVFRDLTDPRLMYLKAGLFLVMGLLCVGAIFAQNPGILTLALLVIAIWSFCRLYYFFFYVIEKYIDSSYKFDSMHSTIIFLIKRNKTEAEQADGESETNPSGAD